MLGLAARERLVILSADVLGDHELWVGIECRSVILVGVRGIAQY